jgi:hypothetical protein
MAAHRVARVRGSRPGLTERLARGCAAHPRRVVVAWGVAIVAARRQAHSFAAPEHQRRALISMLEIRTHTEIDATATEVWAVLTDFDSYPDWNPFITSISGDRAVGGKLRVRIEPPGARAMQFTPTVLAANPSQELRWLGRFLMPGLVDGEHSFQIEALGDNRVRVTQQEQFRGILVPLMRSTLAKTRAGFEAMNAALKARAELAAAAASPD